jgi:glyoxylase-like metal-dependent hydrolase (beta-lactamase superfamily II)
MKELAPGVYLESRYGSGNVGIIVSSAGVVCVDVPMLPSDTKHWLTQIASVTSKPIIAVIQTDYDQERVVSTFMFDVPLIAHDATTAKMKTYSSDKVIAQINDLLRRDATPRRWRHRVPDITFSERLILHKGDREIHVLHGGGHSPATGMVYLPAESLVLAGDVVFCGMHPTMTQAETREWLSALTSLRKMSVDTIVPGHGDPCTRDTTHALSDYIREMRARVRRSYQAGRSKSETSSSVIPEMMDAFPYLESERDQVRTRIKGGSDRIYDEYRAEDKANSARGKGASRRSTKRRRRRRS